MIDSRPTDDDSAGTGSTGVFAAVHDRRLLATAALVAVAMLPVGLFLAALGVFVLEVSGGAAPDTSLVIAVAAYAVADFWGGGIVSARARADARRVAIAWGAARLVVLVVLALLLPRLLPLVPIQLMLAAGAAWAGARMGAKLSAMHRDAVDDDAHDADSRHARRGRAQRVR